MKLRPRHNDVVQVIGHVTHNGLDLVGQACIVDTVIDQVVSMHFTSNDTAILAALTDVEVIYRTEWS